MGVHIGSSNLIMIIYLPYKMVSNALVILLQVIIRDGCVGKDRFIISFNVRWPITRYYYHTEIIPDPSQVLTTLIHRHGLRFRYDSIHTGLLLGEPMYQVTV